MIARDAKLVYMANQIARFFAAQGDEAGAAAGVADHLEKFWPPRMRAEIIAWLAAGGEGLEPAARAGVSRLAVSSPPPGAVSR